METGHVVEVSQAELVSSYIGQTPSQVKDQVFKALGGVLFIDEACTLVDMNEDVHVKGHGGEAVATLLKLMEDHRDNLVVIAAGYLFGFYLELALQFNREILSSSSSSELSSRISMRSSAGRGALNSW